MRDRNEAFIAWANAEAAKHGVPAETIPRIRTVPSAPPGCGDR